MSKLIEMTGQRFGEWTVLHRDSTKKGYRACICSCGTKRSIPRSNLTRGLTTNCGCLQKEKTRARMSTHGKSSTKLYGVWLAMRRRCYLETSKDYPNWGGRGITVCSEWKDDYAAFHDWSMKFGYREGLTIERKDNDKGYSPQNCKWATRTEQNRNRSVTAHLTLNGVRRPLMEWAEISGVNPGTIQSRIKYGWKENELLIPSKGRGANGTNAR